MKTESKPASSASRENCSNSVGPNCSADALYPSLSMIPLRRHEASWPATDQKRRQGLGGGGWRRMGEPGVARYTTNPSLAVLTANRPPSDAAPSQIGPRSAHHLHLVGLDFKDDSDLVRLSPWILVLAQIFLGEGIDMRVCALFGHVLDPPTNLDVPIGIVGVEARKRPRRAFRHIACLHTTFRRIHPDLAVRVVDPYRGHLRRPIRHDCREVSESRFLLQQIQILRGNFHHDCLSSRSLCVTSARGT